MMTLTLLNLQVTLLTYMGIGVVLSKTGMIRDGDQHFLSELVLNVLLPISVFVSFVENISFSLLKSLAGVLFAAILLEMLIYLFTKLPLQKDLTPGQRSVVRYSYLVSNGGLIGTPVIEGLYGSVGVMICNVFLIPTRILAFAAGESLFNPEIHKSKKAICYSILTNKVIVAIALALLASVSPVAVPVPVFTALKAVGKCLSPFSLIVIGSLLAQKITWDRGIMKKLAILCFYRLFGIAFAALFLCKGIGLDAQCTTIATLLLGMPAGSTGAIFAKKYGGDSMFAAAAVFVTTNVSTGSLVILMAVIERVL